MLPRLAVLRRRSRTRRHCPWPSRCGCSTVTEIRIMNMTNAAMATGAKRTARDGGRSSRSRSGISS